MMTLRSPATPTAQFTCSWQLYPSQALQSGQWWQVLLKVPASTSCTISQPHRPHSVFDAGLYVAVSMLRVDGVAAGLPAPGSVFGVV